MCVVVFLDMLGERSQEKRMKDQPFELIRTELTHFCFLPHCVYNQFFHVC